MKDLDKSEIAFLVVALTAGFGIMGFAMVFGIDWIGLVLELQARA